jgi:hypothetical protein
MGIIAATDGGVSYHDVALGDPAFQSFIDRRIYLPELHRADLEDVDALILTCRSNPRLIVKAKEKLQRFLARGGFLLSMGETRPDLWLENIRFTNQAINYWWWLEENPDQGLHVAAPDHPLFRFVTPPKDVAWHYHGWYEAPAGAQPLLFCREGGCILYEDRVSTAGRLLITTLDPFFHHGSHFMPAASRFLHGFLPWLRGEVSG